MFRRRISELVVYDVYIDKDMLPGPVSIEADGNIVLEDFDGYHARLSFGVPVRNIRVYGDVVQKTPVYGGDKLVGPINGIISGTVTLPRNSGVVCGSLAQYVKYGIVNFVFTPVTSVNPGNSRRVDFGYRTREEIINTNTYPIYWKGTPIVESNCIDTYIEGGSYQVVGVGPYTNYIVMVVIVVSE